MNATSAIGRQQSLYDHPGEKKCSFKQSSATVSILCYCQLKANIWRKTVIAIIILFTWYYKRWTVGNRCFLIDSSTHNNNKIITQLPCKWLQITAISKRYSTSSLCHQRISRLIKDISNEQMRHFFSQIEMDIVLYLHLLCRFNNVKGNYGPLQNTAAHHTAQFLDLHV